jgi:two-component system, OmpR family, KDP operon response regulator KdpE
VTAHMMSVVEKKKTVLVVDDQPKLIRFIEISLKLAGFDVISATSGEEALNLVRSANPDIILLDILMPGMDGFQVLRQLRTFSQVPVIAFSASPANREPATRLGANDFMPKPFQPEEMLRRIEALLDGRP